jgi:glycosyltransferase involved in cell wall biosynthesis
LATEQTPIDIVIPVYNEGDNILATLAALAREVRTPIRVLVCYDRDDDDTLTAIREHGSCGLEVVFVKNRSSGAHGAVMTGFATSRSGHVLVYPADDDYNASILDEMFQRAARGNDIVCASRFMKGGSMVGCPWLKSLLVRIAAFTLYHVGRVPTHDATNGFRLFSRRLVQAVTIESTEGFTYSLELLGKCHRLGWPVDEVPARWIERTQGASRFKVLRWISSYLRWYWYIFATTFLSRGPDSVTLKG